MAVVESKNNGVSDELMLKRQENGLYQVLGILRKLGGLSSRVGNESISLN